MIKVKAETKIKGTKKANGFSFNTFTAEGFSKNSKLEKKLNFLHFEDAADKS